MATEGLIKKLCNISVGDAAGGTLAVETEVLANDQWTPKVSNLLRVFFNLLPQLLLGQQGMKCDPA
eukprot:1166246-Amphidinium_carterae.1